MIRNEKGFSLLEVMIAFALIVVIVFATVITQSGSAASAARNKNIIIATNLARNLINEQELKYEGLSFDRLQKKETQNFPEPNKDFTWTIEYEEVDFSALTEILARQGDKDKSEGNDQLASVLKIFKDYMQKSVRRMNVTIEWPEGTGKTQQTFTQLIVNYDTELNIVI